MRAFRFLVVYVLPLTALVGLVLRGPWLLVTPLYVFALTPVLDALLGLDDSVETKASPTARLVYDGVLVLWLVVEAALLAAGLWTVAHAPLSPLEIAGVALSLGLVTGAGGITVAHELVHRRQWHFRAVAEVLMLLVSYPQFCVEHVLGHHKNVATFDDPATARRGESLYRFLPRTLVGSLVSAWRLEGARARKLGLAGTLRDRRVRYPVLLAILYTVVGVGLGPVAALVLAAQGLVAALLLETINYVEHYGLERARLPSGRFERVTARHSWNSRHRLTGWYLFHLPRHADHHRLASLPYYALRHTSGAPELPAGYATMLLAAAVPPLWRRIMEPLVDEARAAAAGEPQKGEAESHDV